MSLIFNSFKPAALLLSSLLVFGSLPVTARADTGQSSNSVSPQVLPLTAPISAWVPSADGNHLYAVSNKTDELYTFNTETMELEGRLHLGSESTDIHTSNDGSLYIAHPQKNYLSVVNLENGTSGGDIETITMPMPTNKIALGSNNQIYYLEASSVSDNVYFYSGYSKLHVTEIQNHKGINDRELQDVSFFTPDVKIETDKNKLYVGEWGAGLYSVDTETFSLDPKNVGYYDNFNSKVIIDSSYVYFAGRKFKKDALNSPLGQYNAHILGETDEYVNYVHDGVVYTNRAVYDGNTYSKLFNLPFSIDNVYVNEAGGVILYRDESGNFPSNEDVVQLYRFNSLDQLRKYAEDSATAIDLQFSSNTLSIYETGVFDVYTTDLIGNPISKVTSLAEVTSSDPGVAYVEDGVIYAVKEGTTEITASFHGLTTSRELYVFPENYYLYDEDICFADTNRNEGVIDPVITWSNLYDDDYAKFRIRFLDQTGRKLNEATYDAIEVENDSSSYQADIPPGDYPLGTSALVLTALNENDEALTSDRITGVYDNVLGAKFSFKTNSDVPSPDAELYFWDEDKSNGTIDGTIHGTFEGNNSALSAMILYFTDNNGKRLQPIAEINATSMMRVNDGEISIKLPSGTKIPSGAAGISAFGKSMDGEESVEGVMMTLWDAPYAKAGNVELKDLDGHRGSMDNVLSWAPTYDESAISEYWIYLCQPYSHSGACSLYKKIAKGQDSYSLAIPSTDTSEGTSTIEVEAVNASGESNSISYYSIADNISLEAAPDLSFDNHSYYTDFSFDDEDGRLGSIGGMLRLYDEEDDEEAIQRYGIYFVNDEMQVVKPILSIDRDSSDDIRYNISIPSGTAIPEGATHLGVSVITPEGETLVYTESLHDEIAAPAPEESQVQITNNLTGTPDTIHVSGLMEGDIVRVYRKPNYAYTLTEGSVAAGKTDISFSLPQLGTAAGNVYISVDRDDYLESERAAFSFKAEKTSSGSHGGGGGGGGPSSAPVNQITTDEYGQTNLEVTPSHTDLLVQLSGTSESLSIDATSPSNTDRVTVQLPADIVEKANESHKAIVITGNGVTLQFPPNSIPADESGQPIRIQTSRVTNANVPLFAGQVTDVMDFSVWSGDERVTPFGSSIEVTFQVDRSKIGDADKAAVYYYNEQTAQWSYVGGTWNSDGAIRVSLPHFSKYAVLNYNKTFADIKGHWAQKEIELMAARQAVSGMTDTAFEPDTNITRAQFVTLLSKALNLKESASTSFADVPSDAWYLSSLNAAYQAGIVSGVSENSFEPDAQITREQMASMLVKAYQYLQGAGAGEAAQQASFSDEAEISPWAKAQVQLAAALGIMKDKDNGAFHPQDAATRAEAAVVIYRLLTHS